jgi:epoxyqueuosine reductase
MSFSELQIAAAQSGGLNHQKVNELAREAGFDAAGWVALPHANDERDGARFAEWLQAGRAGTMSYLERQDEQGRLLRLSAKIPFSWVSSAVVCWANYNSADVRSTEPATTDAGWIARYAWSSKLDERGSRRPSDYHKVLLKRMKRIEAALRAEFGEFEGRAFVDTGPVVERSLAVAAGLGWTGKNTCLIHPKLGSFGFLAVLLTSLEVIEEKVPTALPDRCGSCRRCIDACPTGALLAPYQMDAARCIAYLTIEHRGAIAPDLMSGMGRQVFGCDICQDVCPWNSKAVIGADPELQPRAELINPLLEWLAGLDEAAFEANFNGSPLRRAGFTGFRRNVAIAMGNSGLHHFAPRLAEWTKAADEGLRKAAEWALGQF